MKIPNVRYVKFHSKRNFGVELEMNNKVSAKELVKVVASVDPDRSVLQSNSYVQDYDNTYWHVKFDRSCGDVKNQGGWEVASYKANGYKDVDKIGKVADALKKAGAVVNEECGFHIHAEIADFKHEQAANLVAYWLKIEPIICEMLPKYRRTNKYCTLLSKRFSFNKVYTAKQFWDLVRPQRFDNNDRRVSLNMCNYAQWLPNRKTVELRLPECSLDSTEVKNWVRLFLGFVDFVKKKEFPGSVEQVNLYDAMKIIGLHSEDPFFILSKALRETKIWFMKRILLYSVKRKVREEAEMFLNALELSCKDEPKPVESTEIMNDFHSGKWRWQEEPSWTPLWWRDE